MHAGTIWVLVLLLKAGYSGGAVTINFVDQESCQAAIQAAKQMPTYQDAMCLHQFSGKGAK